MPYLVELRQVAPQLLAVVRDVATSDTLVQKILGSPVWTYLGKHGIKSGGHNIVVYFDEAGRSSGSRSAPTCWRRLRAATA
jgi:hypothetical protein